MYNIGKMKNMHNITNPSAPTYPTTFVTATTGADTVILDCVSSLRKINVVC